MRIPKRYGQSKIDNCPFCGKQAITENKQCIPVCSSHKNYYLENLKCLCGELLDVKKGKYGPYFQCIKCGNMNFRKGLEINPDFNKKQSEKVKKKQTQFKKTYKPEKETKKEIVIRSDELDFYF